MLFKLGKCSRRAHNSRYMYLLGGALWQTAMGGDLLMASGRYSLTAPVRTQLVDVCELMDGSRSWSEVGWRFHSI